MLSMRKQVSERKAQLRESYEITGFLLSAAPAFPSKLLYLAVPRGQRWHFPTLILIILRSELWCTVIKEKAPPFLPSSQI